MEQNNEKNEEINQEIDEVTKNESAEEKTDVTATGTDGGRKNLWWIFLVAGVLVVGIAVLLIINPFAKDNSEPEVSYADYAVTVIDGLGNPVSNVIVKFTDSDGETKTKITDKDGAALLKGAVVGDYTVNIEKGFSDATITQSQYKLNKDVKTLEVVVRNEAATVDIYGDVDDGAFAYAVGVGEYTAATVAGETFYFVFGASTTGIYKISFVSSDVDMTVGYYGIPMFVQSSHASDGEYDGKTFTLTVQDAATPYVIGLNCVNSAKSTLKIERVGDVPFDPAYAPWIEVLPKESFKPCVIPEGSTLTPLDITDRNLSVTLGDDGYYHTSSGELVYVRINSTSAYLDASLALIAGHVSDSVGVNFGGYVYDDDGNFVAKYSYNTLIGSYMEYCDSNGVYPLTEELADAIRLHGENTGWWNPSAPNYLFSSVMVAKGNEWLFLCCVAE